MSFNIVYNAFCATVERAHNHLNKHELLSAENTIQTACNMTFEHQGLYQYRNEMHNIDTKMLLGDYHNARIELENLMDSLGI